MAPWSRFLEIISVPIAKLSCRFDGRVVSATFVSTEAIRCRAPPGRDVVTVSISQNGLDYDGALQFGYYGTPMPQSLTPERGVEAAGALISVKGLGISYRTKSSNASLATILLKARC